MGYKTLNRSTPFGLILYYPSYKIIIGWFTLTPYFMIRYLQLNSVELLILNIKYNLTPLFWLKIAMYALTHTNCDLASIKYLNLIKNILKKENK